jgi:hypothetical protein
MWVVFLVSNSATCSSLDPQGHLERCRFFMWRAIDGTVQEWIGNRYTLIRPVVSTLRFLGFSRIVIRCFTMTSLNCQSDLKQRNMRLS